MNAVSVSSDLDVQRVRLAPDPLAAFNAAGVLAPADVHAAAVLGRLSGEPDGDVLLAAALAVRGPRLSHVCIDLDRVRSTVTSDVEGADLDALPWPDPQAWRAAVAASPLVVDGPDGAGTRPLRLVGSRLYLDRYWRYERRVVDALVERAGQPTAGADREAPAGGLDQPTAGADREAPAGGLDQPTAGADQEALRAALDRRFGPPGGVDLQRLAAATALTRRLAVVAGGPGTGKTTTVTRVLALLADLAGDGPLPRVALTAPTGKAAQRMEESIAEAVDGLGPEPALRAWLLGLEGATLHRLLGSHPGNRTRFRHDRTNQLPHDVVIVDECSMVSLALMAKLLDAVRPEARLVLVGDPEQLASVEAGAVLGDVVGPATAGLRMREQVRAELAAVAGTPVPAAEAGPANGIGDGIVVLERVHRYRADSGIADLAAAIQRGDADEAVAVLGGRDDVRWIEPAEDAGPALAPVRARVAALGREVLTAVRAGDAAAALHALEGFRLLCAHRRGPHGLATWTPRIERWLAEDVDGFDATDTWYVGRPVIVLRNDYQVGVLNGDVGVTLPGADGATTVAFAQGDGIRRLSPSRLEHVETVHAMTVHKAQGSQFREVSVVLPDAASMLLTRELLYTAATRARERLTVVGGEEAVRAAVARRIERASGLRDALWGPDVGP